jgi:adenosylhomocysteine nucleosidase
MSFDEPAPPGGALKIAFVAALAVETASLRRQLPRAPAWLVVQSGPGAARAAEAAARAVDGGARLLVSWGLAGGLDPKLAPGSVVLPRRVLAQQSEPVAVDASWHERLLALRDELVIDSGDLLTSRVALESPDAKRSAAAATGAVAVDMESFGIAAVAARSRIPFVALRVIVDGVDDSLPGQAEQWIDERGGRRLTPALRAAVSPRQWRALLTLAKRYRAARAALENLARALASRRSLTADAAALGAGS